MKQWISAPLGVIIFSVFSLPASAGLVIPNQPMYIDNYNAPMVMLLMSRDHTLYGEAYNDFSDLASATGDPKAKDGVPDTKYITNPSFKYYGYFNSDRCYLYQNNRFEPGSPAVDKKCTSSLSGKWSGDFLNYITTSRMDALRKVLYGGYRSVDKDDEIVLRSSYIPRDAHSWGKSYDKGQGYNITDYTPITDIGTDKNNIDPNTSAQDYKEKVFFTRVSDSDGGTPKLKVLRVQTSKYTQYIWNWVSKERPVANDRIALLNVANSGNSNRNYMTGCAGENDNEINNGPDIPKEDKCPISDAGDPKGFGTIYAYNVDVKVCVAGKEESNCKSLNYLSKSNGTTVVKKPVGFIQEYGYGDQMRFGLMTGSYSNNLKGGVLRAPIGSVSSEFDTDGTISANSNIIATLNTLKIIGFDYSIDNFGHNYGIVRNSTNKDDVNKDKSNVACGVYGSKVNEPMSNGECANWGNPLAEMFEESLRYFAGLSANSNFTYTTANDGYKEHNGTSVETGLALPKPNWNKPLDIYKCSKPFNLIISDVNPNYDGNDFSNDLPGLSSASSWTDKLSARENLETTTRRFNTSDKYFVGVTPSSGSWPSTNNSILGANTLSSLSIVNGLPQEPSKKGTYQLAGLAYFAHTRGVASSAQSTYTKVDTVAVAMSSPIPEIKIKVGEQTVRLMPYARSVAYCVWADAQASAEKRCINSSYQPTASIVDFYITKPLTTTEGEFRVSFDDQEQASDYDMDMVVRYNYRVENSKLKITTTTEYSSVSLNIHAGFAISGTTADGIYLDVRDKRYNDVNVVKIEDKNYVQYDWRYYLDTVDDDGPYKGVARTNRDNFAGHPYPAVSSNMDYQAVNKTAKTKLPDTRERTFTPSKEQGASILPSPLWFAAKWGGYSYTGNSEHTNTAAITADDWARNPEIMTDADLTKRKPELLEPKNYFPVSNPSELKDQLGNALAAMSKNLFSGAGVTISAPTYDAEGGALLNTLVFKTLFYPDGWVGDLVAYERASDGTLTQRWGAATGLKTPTIATRKVIVSKSDGTQVNFKDLPLADAQLANWTTSGICPTDTAPDATTSCNLQLRDYLLGDRTYEGSGYRSRVRQSDSKNSTVLGDIINSRPASAVDKNGKAFVMVAANDGMVHAFDASTGAELFAYVPAQVLPDMYKLADPSYNHQYFADGSITIETVEAKSGATTTSKIIAVGSLGLGRPGLYALDVTDIDNPTILWEIKESDLLSGHTCAGGKTCSDLGNFYSAPAIKKMADGKWWVIFGNGYNSDLGSLASKSGNGVVYLVDALKGTGTGSNAAIKLDTKYGFGKDPRDLAVDASTTHSYNNGIAEPFVADWDGDGLGDAIYAGDLFGNLWKWSWDSNSKTFIPALENGSNPAPIFVATAAGNGNSPYDGLRQAITTRPVVGRESSTTMIFFATGKYLETRDDENDNLPGSTVVQKKSRNITQSIYGIKDYQQWSTKTERSDLQVQSVIAQAKDSNGVNKRAISSTKMATDKKGWLLDLWGVTNATTTAAEGQGITKESTNHGERVIGNPYLSFSVLLVSSAIPVEDACDDGGSSWYYKLNGFTGTTIEKLNTTASGWADNSSVAETSTGLGHGPDVLGGSGLTNDTSGKTEPKVVGEQNRGRLSWRQLF